MAMQDSLAERVTQYLEPGEQAEVVFAARSGLNPWWFLLNALPVIGWIVIAIAMAKAGRTRNVTIVTTERATMVLSGNGRSGAAVLFRGIREPLGDPSGMWSKITVGGQRYWVRRRYHGAVKLANDLPAGPRHPSGTQP